jgi:hypothetical protein
VRSFAGDGDRPPGRYAALLAPCALAVMPPQPVGPMSFPGGLIVSSGSILTQFHG